MKNKNAMTLREYGDKLINEYIDTIVHTNSYLAFIVLSAAIEFIARCRCTLTDFHYGKSSAKRYVDAINNINAFAAYRIFNYKENRRNTNKLYTFLRCGLLHAGMPNKGIVLSSGKNELNKNVVGCLDLYDDVKQAWKEIKSDNVIANYLDNNKGLMISETIPSNCNK